MYCNECGKEFQALANSTVNGSICEGCRPLRDSRSYKANKRFCIDCGAEIPKSRRIYHGIATYSAATFKRCPACRFPKQQNKRCAICGEETENGKFCEKCSEASKEAICKKRREQENVRRLTSRHKDKVMVIYECPCKCDGKHNHHFDYKRPLEVIKLCHSCHMAEHSRLRKLDP